MPVAQLRAYECIVSISQTLRELNNNMERIAVALEKQNNLAEKAMGGQGDEPPTAEN